MGKGEVILVIIVRIATVILPIGDLKFPRVICLFGLHIGYVISKVFLKYHKLVDIALQEIKSVRVRLTDDEYILLLQWQLQNPATGFNACDVDLIDTVLSIESQVEEKIFGDSEIGTYAIYLSEIREDVSLILRKIDAENISK